MSDQQDPGRHEGSPPPGSPPPGSPPPGDSSPPPPPPSGGPPPPPPPGNSGFGAGEGLQAGTLPGLLQRFLARLVDGLLVAVAVAIVIAILGLAPWDLGGTVISAAAQFAYFVYLEGTRGQTFGKQWLGMRVVRVDGSPMDYDAAMRRNWWVLLSIIPFLGGLAQFVVAIAIAITVNSDARNEGFHDKMAGTAVVAA